MEKVGAVCGRFQIFHNEHLAYVLAAKAQCDRLIVGITSPDPSVSPAEQADANRGTAAANPCTYYERMKLVESVLLAAGLARDAFDIVPFPIGKPELMHAYIPAGTRLYVTILDEWGSCKTDRLRRFGYDVQVLWQDRPKGVSSSMLRQRIAAGAPWEAYVPAATYRYIMDHGLDQRIRQLMEQA